MAVPTSKPLDAYVTGTRAWFPDVKAGWVSATQAKDPETDEASGDLVLTFNMDESGEEHLIRITAAQQESNAVLEHLPPLRNPPLLEAADDLTSLSHLNEASVLHTILNRYQQRIIYTYSGIVLIAVNPFFSLNLYSPEIIQAYAGRRKGELEPHLFAVAEDAYRCMIRENRNQTIVVSGESGAGKTMSAKYIMRYFATVEDPDRPQARRTNKDAGGMSETEKAILATNPIMEAFGNAKTTRNDNSSRFGKYLEILFDANYEIAGAKMRTYLLERSRLVYQPEHERNYHIFYQLCAGASQELKLALQLDSAESYHYLNQGGASNLVIAGVDDQAEFLETQKALEIVGIDPAAQAHMFEVLAALLHLGNIAILATRSDSNIAPDDANLLLAAKFLGVDAGELRKWTLKRQMQMRGEKIVSSLSQAHAVAVRDSVAKYVYTCLFDWLVTQMNKSLAPATALEKSTMIGVLDIYGFECFETNSYEQFCINYANERLQHEFNRHVFKLEQEEYVAEQIPWQFISFSDNQPCIDLIQSKFGVLSLLDEESRLPSGTDTGFLQKMYNQLLPKVEFQPFLMKPRFKSESAFTVRHYALDVTYDVEGFMEKNKDTVPDETLSLLSATSNPFLRQVLESRQEETPTDSSLASNNPRKTPGVSITAKKPTLGSQFKSSLSSLMDTINSTEVHYIRCIKPNDQKQAWEVEPQNVLGQLRACGVLETIRISCAGYPSRWTFAEFIDRYYLVAHSKYWDMSSLEKVAELAKHILSATLEPSMYYVGLTKIFFRAGVLASFEQMRRSILHQRTRTIQTAWRRHHVQSRYRCLQQGVLACQTAWRAKQAQRQYQLARETNAARQLQTWVRAVTQRRRFLAMRNTVVQLQIAIRAYQARINRQQAQHAKDATGLQRLVRGALTRRQIKRRQRHVVVVQSLYRRRIARRDLEQRRVEARSASHLQEVSYRLENKVVDLTQSLHDRTRENRELRATLQDLEKQLNTWQSRHEELDARAKGLQEEVERPSVPADEHEQMVEERVSLVAQLDQAQRRINELEAQIQDLQTQLNARALEEKEDGPDSVVHTLRQEIATLRDQLGRANALNAKNGGTVPLASAAAREAPKGPRAVRMASGETPVGSEASLPPLPTDQSPLLNSVTSPDALQDMQRDTNAQALYDEPEVPAEEIIELLENDTQLDEDVLEGLIRYLKVPAPSLQNPPSMKEVLFPAHLISLVTNEMWKYGLVHESERFLANVMQTIQQHVMDFQGDDAIIPGIFWLSNVHEILSFVCIAESDMLQGVGPGLDGSAREFEWGDYERLVTIVKHDLDSLEYNIYHTWMQQSKKLLNKMVVPALVESQSLPGFITNDSGGRLLNRLLAGNHAPTYTMDDILALLNKTWKCLKSYYVEPSVTQQVITELLKMIGVTSFNDLLMRRNFCSWKRAMQIQYNITRLEEWCKSHDMPEGSLQLEHLLQATKLLQLKKATMSDIDIIYDVCWMLTPTQIQKLISHYHVADYENPISPEILKAVASRVVPNDRNDHLLLPPEVDEAGPYELPAAREVTGIETYCPAYLNVPLLRNLAGKVA